MEEKISEYEFVVRAIKNLKKPPYKGIHSVYSGFNQAFREYFNKDPVEATTKLAQEGKIVTRPVRGGATLYLPEDAPSQSKGVLNKILEEDDSDKTQEGGSKRGPRDVPPRGLNNLYSKNIKEVSNGRN